MDTFQSKKITYAISGFDSAWTDKVKEPGALASIVQYKNGKLTWEEPKLTTFTQAQDIINDLSSQSIFHLVAIDQPIVVPNLDSCRPVDRVSASLISKLKGGAQPANRSKENMFGDNAPIWRLLQNIPHKQIPWLSNKEIHASEDTLKQVIIEVFPALAIPSFIPYFFERGKGAKYNPANKKNFNIDDWICICKFIENFGIKHQIDGLAQWAAQEKSNMAPSKSDQDRLDGAICTLIGYQWYQDGIETNLVIGDAHAGYMVTPITSETRCILTRAANKNNVPVNKVWNHDVEYNITNNESDISLIQVKPKAKKIPVKKQIKLKQQKSPDIKEYKCPIIGCDKVFINSRGGWDAHVGALKRHSHWYPEITDKMERKRVFKQDFPEWFI